MEMSRGNLLPLAKGFERQNRKKQTKIEKNTSERDIGHERDNNYRGIQTEDRYRR